MYTLGELLYGDYGLCKSILEKRIELQEFSISKTLLEMKSELNCCYIKAHIAFFLHKSNLERTKELVSLRSAKLTRLDIFDFEVVANISKMHDILVWGKYSTWAQNVRGYFY